MSLHAIHTLDGIKPVFTGSISCRTGCRCGSWDCDTARVLDHEQFKSFSWPFMRDTPATYVDLMLYNGSEVLARWILRGDRADTDLSVQQQYTDELYGRSCDQGTSWPSVVIEDFVGW